MLEVIAKGFALGLSTGVYCMAACAPVMAPYLVATDRPRLRDSAATVLWFSGGRLLAYLALGVAAALFGAHIGSSAAARRGVGIAIAVLAVLLLAAGLERSFPHWGLCARLRCTFPLRRFPVLAGLLTGLNVCPPLLLCLAAITAYSRALTGAVMGASFFLGTSLYLLPFVFVGCLGRLERLRGLAQIAMLFAAVWLMANGIAMLAS
jgi:sulfite exporter TauE/SafE